MKNKLETLTGQMAESVKRTEELESLITQVTELAESIKRIEKDLSKKPEQKSSNNSETTGSKSKATTSKPKKSETTTNKSEKLSYDSMTASQLKAKAKERKINGYSKMTKEQLIAVITSSDKS